MSRMKEYAMEHQACEVCQQETIRQYAYKCEVGGILLCSGECDQQFEHLMNEIANEQQAQLELELKYAN